MFARTFFILALVALAGSIFQLNNAFAKGNNDIKPIQVESPAYQANKEPIFEIKQYINIGGVPIYSVSEDFGMLNVESNAIMDVPLQSIPKDENRDMLLDYGYQMAQYLVPTLYGVKMHELHVGKVYMGVPSMAPEGSLVIVDVKFIRDGLLWSGRVGMMTTDMMSNNAEDQMWFIYPYSR